MWHPGSRFVQTHTLHLGDRARFVMQWQANRRVPARATGDLTILKNGVVLYHRVMRGPSIGMGGTLYSDIQFRSSAAVGHLVALFRLDLGSSVQRSLSFTLLQSPRSDR